MGKILFINCSHRNAYTKSILEKIQQGVWLEHSTELISLRDYNIEHCKGCVQCSKNSCITADDFHIIIEKVRDSNILVLGTPNYFDNICGTCKDFIDRLYPLYFDGGLVGKKIIFVFTGGQPCEYTLRALSNAVEGFAKYQKMNVLGSFAFETDEITIEDVLKDDKLNQMITLLKSNND